MATRRATSPGAADPAQSHGVVIATATTGAKAHSSGSSRCCLARSNGVGAGMVARLGNVLYWFSCAVAIPFGLLSLLSFYVAIESAIEGNIRALMAAVNPFLKWEAGTLPTGVQCLGIALASWLCGRAARYILAGE